MDNRLHPVMQQALRPFMPPLTEAERQSADIRLARRRADHHARNDLQALKLQIAENLRNDLNWWAL